MAVKHTEVPGLGKVTLYKRRGNRSISLSLSHDGRIRISLPMWVPYRAGLEFARTRSEWLSKKQAELQSKFVHGQAIGKAHHLSLLAVDAKNRVGTRLKGSDVIVTYPTSMTAGNEAVQAAARTASFRALKKEADSLLPQRLASLAESHGFTYREVRLRHLKSRWGSCSSAGTITLNIYLMQLPWQLIDYVLMHELIHTKVMKHNTDFWKLFEEHLASAKKLRKEVHKHRPTF